MNVRPCILPCFVLCAHTFVRCVRLYSCAMCMAMRHFCESLSFYSTLSLAAAFARLFLGKRCTSFISTRRAKLEITNHFASRTQLDGLKAASSDATFFMIIYLFLVCHSFSGIIYCKIYFPSFTISRNVCIVLLRQFHGTRTQLNRTTTSHSLCLFFIWIPLLLLL